MSGHLRDLQKQRTTTYRKSWNGNALGQYFLQRSSMIAERCWEIDAYTFWFVCMYPIRFHLRLFIKFRQYFLRFFELSYLILWPFCDRKQ
jgi:hypothetical protein